MSRSKTVVPVLFTLLAACGGQVGEEGGAECASVNSIPLARADVSPLGFSADEVLTHVGSERTVSVSWANGGTTEATITFSSSLGEIQFHDREIINSGGQEAGALDCGDTLEIPTSVSFVTADGAFNETWSLSLFASVSDVATLATNLEQISGSFELAPYVPTGEWDSVRAWVSLQFGADSNGAITGQAAGEDGEVAYAENFNVAQLIGDEE